MDKKDRFQCPSGHFLIQTEVMRGMPENSVDSFNARQGIS